MNMIQAIGLSTSHIVTLQSRVAKIYVQGRNLVGRIRAVIGLQLCDTHVGNFKAQEIAITFATKECNADTVHLASAGLYVDANCLPFVLYQGNLQPTTLARCLLTQFTS